MKRVNYWRRAMPRRRCNSTGSVPSLVEGIWASALMWGSDYPHPTGVAGGGKCGRRNPRKYIEEAVRRTSREVVHKITCGKSGKFSGLNQLRPRRAGQGCVSGACPASHSPETRRCDSTSRGARLERVLPRIASEVSPPTRYAQRAGHGGGD